MASKAPTPGNGDTTATATPVEQPAAPPVALAPESVPEERPKEEEVKPSVLVDQTIPGGRYYNEQGKLINAEGKRIHEDGKVLTDEEVTAENAASA